MWSVVYADALIACFDAKYHYAFWRPVTAIRAGNTDDNGRTIGDPAWSPLLPATPNHPEYPSAHSCITPSGGRVVARFLRITVDRLHRPQPDRPRRSLLRHGQGTAGRGRRRPHLGWDPLPLGGQGRHRHRQAGHPARARQPLPPHTGLSRRAITVPTVRLEPTRIEDVPVPELSGLALSTGRAGRARLLAIGDRKTRAGPRHADRRAARLDRRRPRALRARPGAVGGHRHDGGRQDPPAVRDPAARSRARPRRRAGGDDRARARRRR